MARIKYGPIIGDISGSIGSATFQKSLYGNVLRTRPRGTKTATQPQLVARGIMAACQLAWQNLSAARRKQWDQYIAFAGASIKRDRGILLDGHSLFVRYNYMRLTQGFGISDALNYKVAPAFPKIDSILFDGDNIQLNFTADLTTLGLLIHIKFSSPRLPSQAFNKSGLRIITNWGYGGTAASCSGQWIPVFGQIPAEGSLIHYELYFWHVSDPIISPAQTGILTIAYA